MLLQRQMIPTRGITRGIRRARLHQLLPILASYIDVRHNIARISIRAALWQEEKEGDGSTTYLVGKLVSSELTYAQFEEEQRFVEALQLLHVLVVTLLHCLLATRLVQRRLQALQ